MIHIRYYFFIYIYIYICYTSCMVSINFIFLFAYNRYSRLQQVHQQYYYYFITKKPCSGKIFLKKIRTWHHVHTSTSSDSTDKSLLLCPSWPSWLLQSNTVLAYQLTQGEKIKTSYFFKNIISMNFGILTFLPMWLISSPFLFLFPVSCFLAC